MNEMVNQDLSLAIPVGCFTGDTQSRSFFTGVLFSLWNKVGCTEAQLKTIQTPAFSLE
jgi:hypothetical protein